MNIEDLRASVSQMSDADLMSLLIEVRASRRVNKKPVAEKKEKKVDLSAMIKGMSAKDMQQLLDALEGDDNGE